jgi:hypothetical protein
MSKEQPWDRATRLYALALKARENNQVRYAEQLEDMAAEAAAEADRLARSAHTSEWPPFNKPTDHSWIKKD